MDPLREEKDRGTGGREASHGEAAVAAEGATAERSAGPTSGQQPAHEMRVPLRGIPEEGIGVGDLVKRVTDIFRIKPCDGCERRRQVLNRWVIKGSGGTPGGSGEGRP